MPHEGIRKLGAGSVIRLAAVPLLDADGRRVGRVSMPARFRIGRIVGDAVYGVERDELDRERIVRLRLERAGEIG